MWRMSLVCGWRGFVTRDVRLGVFWRWVGWLAAYPTAIEAAGGAAPCAFPSESLGVKMCFGTQAAADNLWRIKMLLYLSAKPRPHSIAPMGQWGGRRGTGRAAGFRIVTPSACSVLVAGLVFLMALLFFIQFSVDLPVLREMRGIIFYGGWISHFSIWDEIAHPVGGISAGSRMTAMLLSALDARVCGFDARCINTSQAMLMAVATSLLFLHLTQLLANRWVAALLALMWCLSLPALEAGLWQAIQLDKLAMSLSLLYLIVLFRFIREGKKKAPGYLSCNLLLVLLLLLAFKSKEISFLLVPVTVLVVLVEGESEGMEGIMTRALFVILPVGYGIFYILHYLRYIPPDMQAHVLAGNPVKVLPVLLFGILGDEPLLDLGGWGNDYSYITAAASITMVLAIISAGISFVIARRTTGPGMDNTARNGIYLAGLLVCGILIPARTEDPHPYYLMIAEGALLGLIGLAVLVPIRGLARPVDTTRRFGLLGLLGVAMLLGYAAQRTPGSAAIRIQQMGRIINDSFATIRSAVPPEAITDVQFLFPTPIDGDWYLFGNVSNDGGPDPEMMSFVYRRRVPVYVIYRYGSADDSAPNPGGTMRVVWNADGSVRDIELGPTHIELDPIRGTTGRWN